MLATVLYVVPIGYHGVFGPWGNHGYTGDHCDTGALSDSGDTGTPLGMPIVY